MSRIHAPWALAHITMIAHLNVTGNDSMGWNHFTVDSNFGGFCGADCYASNAINIEFKFFSRHQLQCRIFMARIFTGITVKYLINIFARKPFEDLKFINKLMIQLNEEKKCFISISRATTEKEALEMCIATNQYRVCQQPTRPNRSMREKLGGIMLAASLTTRKYSPFLVATRPFVRLQFHQPWLIPKVYCFFSPCVVGD